jgi:hypothetical protein
MNTKISIGCLAIGLLMLGQPARAATPASAHTASFQSGRHSRQAHRSATFTGQNISGVIPRAIRGGNPLQMLNPLAPAKYGTAEQNVSLDPDVPGKANGINFFTISF